MKIDKACIDRNMIRLIDEVTGDVWDDIFGDTKSHISLAATITEVRGILVLGEELKKVLDE